MGRSSIEWTDETWNPVRGCTRVSAGCEHCYAERQAARFAGVRLGKPGPFAGLVRTVNGHPTWTGTVSMHPELLDAPARWRRPRRVFVNSMSDLFHEGVLTSFIDRVFLAMAEAPRHVFQVLTKRPARMKQYLDFHKGSRWPPPNVWLGVSVEDQATADERIPLLLSTRAAVRFVSYEPALGPVDFVLRGFRMRGRSWDWKYDTLLGHELANPRDDSAPSSTKLDWIIVGGESGPGARPCDVQWIRNTVRECYAAAVPVFVKQLGARPAGLREYCDRCNLGLSGGKHGLNCPRTPVLRSRKGGNPAEWPEDLRVREFPNVEEAHGR